MVSFLVPRLPPSKNRKLHHRGLSEDEQDWRTQVWGYYRQAYIGNPLTGPLGIEVVYYGRQTAKSRTRDGHNFDVACYDALKPAGVIADDSQIVAWRGEYHQDACLPPGRTAIAIYRLTESE